MDEIETHNIPEKVLKLAEITKDTLDFDSPIHFGSFCHNTAMLVLMNLYEAAPELAKETNLSIGIIYKDGQRISSVLDMLCKQAAMGENYYKHHTVLLLEEGGKRYVIDPYLKANFWGIPFNSHQRSFKNKNLDIMVIPFNPNQEIFVENVYNALIEIHEKIP